jgi:translocator protein
MKVKSVITFLLCLLIPLLIGGISGIATADAIPNWYQTLHRPSFNPPNWLFGPVWTLLYLLMGISLYMIWTLPKSQERKRALQMFAAQITLNFFWSIIFFSFHQINSALIEIIALWICIAMMIHAFRKLRPVAGYLNIPYLLWVSFATVLNAAYAVLN